MKHLPATPFVCLITKGELNPANYEFEKINILETIREAISDGVHLVQVREKGLSARLLFDLVTAVVKIAGKTESLILVNDRSDIAAAASADGVHLPATSIPPQAIRRMFSNRLIIGVSTHSIDEAHAAVTGGADYLFFGPVFESPGKGPATGTAPLEGVCRKFAEIPVLALGGIDPENFDSAIHAGAAGIAAIRALNDRDSRLRILRHISDPSVR